MQRSAKITKRTRGTNLTKSEKGQSEKFIETAREHGADMTEDQFKKAMGKIAPKPKGGGA